MPIALPNLYCTPQDVYNLVGIDAAQLRQDDRNLASGQTMQAVALVSVGGTSITLASALQYPMLIGTNLVFDGGGLAAPVEATLSAVANVGDTSLTVSAVSSAINAGAEAVDNGVTVWTANLMTVACQRATSTVKRYCQPRYDDSQLVQANSVNDWATTIASRWLGIRLYRAAPSYIESMYEEAMNELRMVKDGELNIEDIPTRTSEWPFLSNVTIDLAYTVRKVRVEPQISEGTPTQYPQAIDWNSYLLLEW